MGSCFLKNGKIEMISHDDFLKFNIAKILKINCITHAFYSFSRIRKYLALGYNCDEAYDYLISLFESRKNEKGIIMNSKYY